MIKDLKNLKISHTLEGSDNFRMNILPEDSNGREIDIFKLCECYFGGENLIYPNIIAHSEQDGTSYFPIREEISSLKDVNNNKSISLEIPPVKKEGKYFFFCYNTDNYYHFIYDTLPYLISFRQIKKNYPDLKILISYPNLKMKHQYKFVDEFLDLLDIKKEDIFYIGNFVYEEVYFSSSFTHDGKSEKSPRKEIFNLYKEISEKCIPEPEKDFPKKIYISRRSWIHQDYSNIGTNYTLRRKLENEDLLVSELTKLGFVEIFTEKLSTVEKIQMFSKAESVIGSIGGGIANVLFSPPETKLISIVSPTFLEVNNRFRYCLENVNLKHFTETYHTESGKFKTNMRVICKDGTVGEIKNINGNEIDLIYSNSSVSGWNGEVKFKEKKIKMEDCNPLDKGLNSPWEIPMDKFKVFIKEII